jgi:hypothetical protein
MNILSLLDLLSWWWARSSRRIINRTPPAFPSSGVAYWTWYAQNSPNYEILPLFISEPLGFRRFRAEVRLGADVSPTAAYSVYVTVNGVEHQMYRPNPPGVTAAGRLAWIYDHPEICAAGDGIPQYKYSFRVDPPNPPRRRSGAVHIGPAPYVANVEGALDVGWFVKGDGRFFTGGEHEVRMIEGIPLEPFVILNQGKRVLVVNIRFNPASQSFRLVNLPVDFPATAISLKCGEWFEFSVEWDGPARQARLEMTALFADAPSGGAHAMDAFATLDVLAPPG